MVSLKYNLSLEICELELLGLDSYTLCESQFYHLTVCRLNGTDKLTILRCFENYEII